MNLSLQEDFQRILGRDIRVDEPMSEHTTLGVGGPADVFLEVETEDELCQVMKYLNEHSVSWMIVGDGANLLVADKGIRGVVIHPTGDFEKVVVDGLIIIAGAAVAVSKVADIAAEHGLTGLEGVGTVPGSLGGTIVMNAGTHQGYIESVVRSVSIVTYEGERKHFPKKECGFTYRGSRFQWDNSIIVTAATLSLAQGDPEKIAASLESVREHRAKTQPKGRSAGCFFKNPPRQSAGMLIVSAGGAGQRIGGAVISDKHANFIMNENNASASDLYNLAEQARELVRRVHGVELEYEVRLVGEW